jgi:hypothetical protein
VFHFMVSAADREGYLDVLRRTLRPGGHVSIATFGRKDQHNAVVSPSSATALRRQRVLGEDFELASSSLATHHTPSEASQQFLYSHLLRRPIVSSLTEDADLRDSEDSEERAGT